MERGISGSALDQELLWHEATRALYGHLVTAQRGRIQYLVRSWKNGTRYTLGRAYCTLTMHCFDGEQAVDVVSEEMNARSPRLVVQCPFGVPAVCPV